MLKTILIILISSVIFFFIWFSLPVSILYYSEIKSGNGFVENINAYKKRHGILPDENRSDTLAKLNPMQPYETFYPQYRKIDENNFELTYIVGFDPPYLRYDTKTKKWKKK